MNLPNKYRPKSLDEIKGNSQTVTILSSMLSDLATCPHSFLITGPTGCGKTTIGRIIADELGCDAHDFKEINTANNRGIDTIRTIIDQTKYKPMNGPVTVYIIDECHKMTNDAQNALLKVLEDTPTHVYFVLCTTDPQKLTSTIKGRCTTFAVELLDDSSMMKLLREVSKAEGQRLEKIVYDQIILDSLGHARNALQILDQVLRVDPEDRLEVAQQSAEKESQIIELCRALLSKKATWMTVNKILTGLQKEEPETIRRAVLGYCKSVLLKGNVPRAGLVMEEFAEPQGLFWNLGFPQVILACFRIMN